MTRSLSKGPFCEINPLLGEENTTIQKIWSRRSVILPQFVGRKYLIYNGKIFISLNVSEEMVGHKFGEFATTRKKAIHKKKSLQKKSLQKKR